jgi:glutamyl-tRNA synthetase
VPLDEGTEKAIKTIALKNSIEHGGKAQLDAVTSKLLGSRPDLRKSVKDVMPDLKQIVQYVNSLSQEAQKSLLLQLSPGDVERKQSPAPSDHGLPPLRDAVHGKVITRFPPEPNGYPHIGHAKAAIIDEEYARMYGGKLILRFDDTNPLKEKLEYYEAIREGLDWLGVKPDIVKNTSDDIELLSSYGRKLVELDGAYVCTCSQEKIHDLRGKGLACECRADPSIVPDRLKKFFGGSYEPNKAIIRFKGNMADQNTAMRDPALFRIIDGNHPKLGDKFRIWPTYDFAAPIEDSLDGVTHAMRTKEYELRNELYFAILDRLQLRKPTMIEFSRLEFEGVPVSKRKIRPLIDNGTIQNWDDPRLPTLKAFKRRGFVPAAIRKFVLSLGITLAETKPPFETLEAFNRKMIDPLSPRLFFVRNPVSVQIGGAKVSSLVLKNHPTDITLGTRNVSVNGSVYISGEDSAALKEGDTVRLIEYCNIRVLEVGHNSVSAELADNEIKQSMKKIQWVAKNDIVEYKILIPKELYIGEEYNTNSLEVAQGFAESFTSTLKADTSVQFVRFGFCRIDDARTAILTHR